MPGMNGTGPLGQGPMTGRGLGPCGAGFRRGFSRGMGRGFGRGMGWRQMTPIPVQMNEINEKETLENERKAIEEDIDYLKEELTEIIKRLKDLKKQD